VVLLVLSLIALIFSVAFYIINTRRDQQQAENGDSSQFCQRRRNSVRRSSAADTTVPTTPLRRSSLKSDGSGAATNSSGYRSKDFPSSGSLLVPPKNGDTDRPGSRRPSFRHADSSPAHFERPPTPPRGSRLAASPRRGSSSSQFPLGSDPTAGSAGDSSRKFRPESPGRASSSGLSNFGEDTPKSSASPVRKSVASTYAEERRIRKSLSMNATDPRSLADELNSQSNPVSPGSEGRGRSPAPEQVHAGYKSGGGSASEASIGSPSASSKTDDSCRKSKNALAAARKSIANLRALNGGASLPPLDPEGRRASGRSANGGMVTVTPPAADPDADQVF